MTDYQQQLVAALQTCDRTSITVAQQIWERNAQGEDLSEVCKQVEIQLLKLAMRELRRGKLIQRHRFALSIARAIHQHPSQQSEIVRYKSYKTSPERLLRLRQIEPGTIYRDCLIKSTNSIGAFVELESAIDGLLHPANMLSDTQADCAALPLTPGNRVSVVVLEVDYSRGDVLVGQKQLRFAEWEETARSRYFVGQDVKVRVKRICKDVALVSLDNGFEGVLPSVHLQWAEDAGVALPFLPPQPEVDAEVVAIDFANQSIVLSRSKAIQAELERRDKLLSEFTVGEVRKGIVKKIADFGAFIELEPGVNGMIHVTEMSWRRVAPHPREILNIGQEIEVSVLQINHEKRHVSLSLKRLVGDPWTGIEAKFPVGTKVKGKVLKLVAYGAVIELEPGVNGLVHVTELSWTMRITKPDEVLKLGQEIDAVVLAVNREEEKIALGVRQLTFNPWEQARGKYPHGTSIKGKVQSLARYGAFVEFGDGLYGLIHVSNISWTRTIKHSSKAFQVGDEVEVMILSVDPVKQRISMGVKQLTNDPWLTISDYFKIGTLVTGKVVETCGIGASLLLPGGFHGLIHKSEIPLDAGKSVSDFLAIGQDVMARVKALDTGKRRIGLSLKL